MACFDVDIGGHLETVEAAQKLADTIVSEILEDLNGEMIMDVSVAQTVMRSAIEAGTMLSLRDTSRWEDSGFDELEEAIYEHHSLQLMITRYNDNSPNVIERFWVEDGAEMSYSAEAYEYGGVLLSAKDIRDALSKENPIDAVNSLIELVERQAGGDFPPLTASPAVMAWLKIFGDKVA